MFDSLFTSKICIFQHNYPQYFCHFWWQIELIYIIQYYAYCKAFFKLFVTSSSVTDQVVVHRAHFIFVYVTCKVRPCVLCVSLLCVFVRACNVGGPHETYVHVVVPIK